MNQKCVKVIPGIEGMAQTLKYFFKKVSWKLPQCIKDSPDPEGMPKGALKSKKHSESEKYVCSFPGGENR